MAWWEDDRPTLADQLADSSRPIRTDKYDGQDESGVWFYIPIAWVIGLAFHGIAVLCVQSGLAPLMYGLSVSFSALGLYLMSQFGVLGYYAVQSRRFEERRLAAARAGEAAPPLTDQDIKQFHIPMGYRNGGFYVGRLAVGDGPTTPTVRVARTVGLVLATVFYLGVPWTLLLAMLEA